MASFSPINDDQPSGSSSHAPINNGSRAFNGTNNHYTNNNNNQRPTIDDAVSDDDADEIDLLGRDPSDEILLDDPLRHDLAEPVSFKRKQKRSIFSHPSRILTALTGGGGGGGGGGGSSSNPNRNNNNNSPTRQSPIRSTHPLHTRQGSKDGVPLDWYVEGPGRRVGYEDLTAIDWIFEYTKERQRLRQLYSSATGILGYIRQALDASQVWVVLVLTGLAVGVLAAGIDVTTDWLGDIKYGFCTTKDGGAFYLSRTACCYGYDDHAQCIGWTTWGQALGASSKAASWFAGYSFYLVLAVWHSETWAIRKGCVD